MEPVDTTHIRRRMDRARINHLLGELMPHAQAVLVDWSWDLVADDGTPISAYHHAWTRKEFFLSDDGRLFRWDEQHRIVEGGDCAETMRGALPTLREWLELGGYAAGDLLGAERELAN